MPKRERCSKPLDLRRRRLRSKPIAAHAHLRPLLRRLLRLPKAARSGGDDDLDADATALLMYTSGTTGVPKGVMLTHANLVANAASISAEHRLGRHDRVLGVLPLYHINAFVVTMLAPLAHHGSVAMAAEFSAQQFWQQAIAQGCTWINVVPTIVSYLIEGAAPAREALAAIRFCRSASAPLPPEHHRAFEARFGIGIVETMGLTETAAPSFSQPARCRRSARSARSAAPRAARRASSTPTSAPRRRRHDRRDRHPRRARHARLLQEPRRRRATPSRPTAGCAPATSAIATATASSSSPAASRS